MTRFARATGSKSSNERTPNEATPWHVMKQQLVENLSNKEEQSKKVKHVKELLEEKQSTHTDWAEFENTTTEKSSSVDPTNNKVKKKSLKRTVDESDNSLLKRKIKKHKRDKDQSSNVNDTQINEVNHSISDNNKSDTTNDKLIKNKTKDKHEPGKFVKALVNQNNSSEIPKNRDDTSNTINTANKKKEAVLSKRQKRNMKKKNKDLNDTTNESNKNAEPSTEEKQFGTKETINSENNIQSCESKDNKHAPNKFNKNFEDKSDKFGKYPNKFGAKKSEAKKNHHLKPPKIRDDKEHKRRKPDVGSTKMTINGVEIEVVKFDSFPVKKEDAERLKELRKKMIMKGIPKAEINAAMKLERRKAEKALARLRKCVCFHCRKAGHNLSDCPELGSEQAGTGICFKCGSTEHTHFECKVAKPTEFRYATCFICREQGHIAKQCPDNPKGIYPQGGACNICGDVTHLKKDCPDLIKEKEEHTITLDTIANNNVESLEQDVKSTNVKISQTSKKIVKF